jgi:hypothetical protein
MAQSEQSPEVVFSAEELSDLRRAKALLENPGLTARLASLVGSPLERGFKMLPPDWSLTVNKAVRTALLNALRVAMGTLPEKAPRKSSEMLHKVMVGASGGFGGAFGLPALMVELPVSTTIMLRSIADIARSEGHKLTDATTKLSCLEVFALGGTSKADDGAETAYWAVRAGLSKALSEAAMVITERGVVERGAPAIVRFIGAIASRFGVVVSEQVAAKAVPVVGAAGGATINVLFMDHFQNMARGHFIVKRLVDRHGLELVRSAYHSLAI